MQLNNLRAGQWLSEDGQFAVRLSNDDSLMVGYAKDGVTDGSCDVDTTRKYADVLTLGQACDYIEDVLQYDPDDLATGEKFGRVALNADTLEPPDPDTHVLIVIGDKYKYTMLREDLLKTLDSRGYVRGDSREGNTAHEHITEYIPKTSGQRTFLVRDIQQTGQACDGQGWRDAECYDTLYYRMGYAYLRERSDRDVYVPIEKMLQTLESTRRTYSESRELSSTSHKVAIQKRLISLQKEVDGLSEYIDGSLHKGLER